MCSPGKGVKLSTHMEHLVGSRRGTAEMGDGVRGEEDEDEDDDDDAISPMLCSLLSHA